MTDTSFVRQFISDYIQGPNAEALIATIADEGERLDKLTIAVNDQLSISTASGEYLIKRLSEVGLNAPPDLGMDDLAYRKLGIQVSSVKQLASVIHSVLETFYGEDSVRAWAQSGRAEPYFLKNNDELFLELDDGTEVKIPFQTKDFLNISEATAQEVSDVITRFLGQLNYKSFASVYEDARSKEKYVRIYGSALGPYSMIRIIGGEVQSRLEFAVMRPTELSNNTTVWEITRTVGSTTRFRWYSGPQPALANVTIGDSVLIYGDGFKSFDLSGTFAVTNLRPAQPIPSYDSGWFEVENYDLQTLRATPPNVPPPPNTPTERYSFIVSQSAYDDLKFFLPKKNTSYGKTRYAVAFEALEDTLKLYLPATTKVVHRDIIGAAHLHPLYDELNLDGSFGHASDKSKQVVVISSHAVSYPQNGYDNEGFSGKLRYNANEIDIEYVRRENGRSTVICKTPHGIKGDSEWSSLSNYVVGDIVFYESVLWECAVNSGPLYGGSIVPSYNTNVWSYNTTGLNYTSQIISVDVYDVESEPVESFKGPYVIDPAAPYALTDKQILSREKILAGTKIKTLTVNGVIDPQPGLVLFDLNKPTQEGPIDYFSSQVSNAPTAVAIASLSQTGFQIVVNCSSPHGVIAGGQVQISGITTIPAINGTYTVDSTPNSLTYTCTSPVSRTASIVGEGLSSAVVSGAISTLLIDPAYTFKFGHDVGADITLLSDRRAYVPEIDGSDYPFYLTGTVEGRQFCQDLTTKITALGIKLEVVVVYPDGFGYGHGTEPLDGDKNNDVTFIWG